MYTLLETKLKNLVSKMSLNLPMHGPLNFLSVIMIEYSW